MRTVIRFNDDWLFAPYKLEQDAGDERFERVTLPHTNRLFAHRQVDARDYQFISTYRKTFRLPEPASSRSVYLDFDGAMLESTIFVNGHGAGTYAGGYTPFSVDVTPYLITGENLVTVILDSTERKDLPPYGHLVDFLPFGGIYRDVYLRMVDPCHITGIFARPQNVLTAPQLECDIQLSQVQSGLTLEAVLTDQQQKLIAQASQPISADSCTVSFPVLDQVTLWSLDQPALYTVEVTLMHEGAAIDRQEVRFGFRSAEFRADGSFYLNNQPLKLFGLNRHQTYPYIGAAAPKRLQQMDADILKNELSCNIVRTSHYPQSPHFLDRCDEIGLLVFEEMPGWQHIGDARWQEVVLHETRQMIVRDCNHPSVILWGVRINESPDCARLYAQTNELAHQLDPTRQTGGVRNFIESDFLEDVFTYNDFSFGIKEPRFQPHLITEFSGHMFPTKTWDLEERRIEHALIHVSKHDLQMGRPDIAGAIGWCAFDYSTNREFGSGDRICHHGVMDIFRLPKWAAYFYHSQKSPEQEIVLHVASLWTGGDRSGGGSNPLTIFSNCDEVEVHLGDQRLGCFQPDREHYPNLPYPPFTIHWADGNNPWGKPFDDLTVIGYVGGKPVAEHRIDANHRPNRLNLYADSTSLKADGSDMTRLVIRLEDRYGNVLPYHIRVIHFELEGEADMIGENPLALIGGQAAIYVRSRHTEGVVKVTARALELPSVSVDLQLEPDE